MKKILLIIIVALCSINAKSQTHCFKTTIVGNNIEFSISADQGNFQLLAAGIYFTLPATMTLVDGTATTTLLNYFPSFVAQGGNEYYFSIVNPSATYTTMTTTATIIGTVPFTGAAGAITTCASPPCIAVNKVGSMLDLAPFCTVLPTELLSFKGDRKGKVSQLQWEATNEKNLVSYIVERSNDGKNFHPLGFTKPKSFNALEKVAYDFIDDSPEIGINYYRLLSKGTGKDEKYSKVISLDFGLGLSGRAFPNPLDGDLSVELDIEENSGEVTVGVYDVVGKQVLSKKLQNSDRRINFVMPTTELPPGVYVIKVKVGNTLWERKLTKM
jgi:Secretion system C-terminal sorting domain